MGPGKVLDILPVNVWEPWLHVVHFQGIDRMFIFLTLVYSRWACCRCSLLSSW